MASSNTQTAELASLADLYAVAKAEADAAAKKADALRKPIIATGVQTLMGQFFAVEVGLSERSSLDSKLVKALLDEQQIAECTKVTLVETLRIKASLSLAA